MDRVDFIMTALPVQVLFSLSRRLRSWCVTLLGRISSGHGRCISGDKNSADIFSVLLTITILRNCLSMEEEMSGRRRRSISVSIRVGNNMNLNILQLITQIKLDTLNFHFNCMVIIMIKSLTLPQ